MKKASLSSEYVYLEFQLLQGSESECHPSLGGRPSLWTQSQSLQLMLSSTIQSPVLVSSYRPQQWSLAPVRALRLLGLLVLRTVPTSAQSFIRELRFAFRPQGVPLLWLATDSASSFLSASFQGVLVISIYTYICVCISNCMYIYTYF